MITRKEATKQFVQGVVTTGQKRLEERKNNLSFRFNIEGSESKLEHTTFGKKYLFSEEELTQISQRQEMVKTPYGVLNLQGSFTLGLDERHITYRFTA